MRFRLFSRTVFWRNLRGNLIMVLLIAIFVLLLFGQMRVFYRNQEIIRVESILQNSLENISSQLDSLRSQLTQTKFYDSLRKVAMITDEFYPSDYITLRNVQNSLSTITSANATFSDVVVHFSRNGVVLTRHHVYLSNQDFLKHYHTENIQMEQLMTQPFDSFLAFDFFPGGTIQSLGQAASNVAFGLRLPLSAPNIVKPYNYAYLFVCEEVFLNLLSPIGMSEYSFVELKDKEGKKLYAYYGDDEQTKNEELITVRNQLGTLTIEAALSQTYFAKALGNVQTFINISIVVVFLIGIIAAFLTARQQSLPIRKLVAEFSGNSLKNSDQRNEYRWLKENLLRMNWENKDAAKQLEQYRQQLQNTLIEKLIMGTMMNKEQQTRAEKLLKNLSSPFAVGYGKLHFSFPLDSAAAQETRSLVLMQKVKELDLSNSILYPIDNDTFALLLSYQGDLLKTAQSLQKELAKLSDAQNYKVKLVLSPPLTQVEEIAWAYDRAKMYDATTFKNNNYVSFFPGERTSDEQYYSLRNLQKLYDYISAGAVQEALEQLCQLIQSTYEPGTSLKQRFQMIRGLLLLCATSMELDNQEAVKLSYTSSDDATSIIKKAGKVIVDFTNQINNKNITQKDKRMKEILQYMNDSFTQSDCSPATIAKAFSFSEKHLYTLFKEHAKATPAAYLLQLRLNYAANLLVSTDDVIQQVSEQAGFYNFNTFYKAFKRSFGLTPSKYRERERGHPSSEDEGGEE